MGFGPCWFRGMVGLNGVFRGTCWIRATSITPFDVFMYSFGATGCWLGVMRIASVHFCLGPLGSDSWIILAPLQPRSALHARCTICACQPLEAQGGTLVRQSFRQVDDGQNFEAAQSQDHRQKLQTAPNKYRRDELAIQKGPKPDARHVLYAFSTPPI